MNIRVLQTGYQVHMVIDEDNTDPHGLFRFRKASTEDTAVMSEMNSGEVEPFSTFNLTKRIEKKISTN